MTNLADCLIIPDRSWPGGPQCPTIGARHVSHCCRRCSLPPNPVSPGRERRCQSCNRSDARGRRRPRVAAVFQSRFSVAVPIVGIADGDLAHRRNARGAGASDRGRKRGHQQCYDTAEWCAIQWVCVRRGMPRHFQSTCCRIHFGRQLCFRTTDNLVYLSLWVVRRRPTERQRVRSCMHIRTKTCLYSPERGWLSEASRAPSAGGREHGRPGVQVAEEAVLHILFRPILERCRRHLCAR